MKWVVGGAVIAMLAVSFYLASPKRPLKEAIPRDGLAVADVPDRPAEQSAATQPVVEVGNLDDLLDPPATPMPAEAKPMPVLISIGFEDSASVPVAPVEVKPIPKSTDETSEAKKREQLFSFRVGLFGN